jgi:two-component system, chemotaxis family, CheB/CheR fusion protein
LPAVEVGRAYAFEVHGHPEAGGMLAMEIQKQPARAPSVRTVKGSGMDNTKRDKKVAELQQQFKRDFLDSRKSKGKSLAAEILDTIREPFLVLNDDLRVVFGNEQFYRHFRVAPSQTLNNVVYDLGNGQWDIPKLRELLGKVLPHDKVFDNFEVQHDFPDIGTRTLLLNARRIDHLQLILLAMEDITNRRQAEMAMLESKEEARQYAEDMRRARDRAERLTVKLQDQTRILERANTAKDEFLANISHEIRTPVGEVIGMTDVLLQQDVPGPIREDLEIIRFSAGTILTLTNDLLDLSRIEQGKLELNIRTFSLKERVSTLVRPFEMVALNKGIKLEFIFGEDVPDRVKCDPDRVGQVLKNLLSNAMKFTERGSVTLLVQLIKGTDHLARLRFSVSDTGIGIPRKNQDRLFQPFTQIDPSFSKKFAGVGLGLAISKRLAELMGGEISVESEPGKGSTFTMTLVTEKADEEARKTPASLTLPDIPPLSILIAEDNAVNRLFLRRALITAGHKVDEAENGKHALEMLKDNHFDLVLMDIQMPEMDGLEAMRRIRSGKNDKADIPIIALTAYAMKGDREKFLDNGMDGYVTKPVDFGELARVIAEVCGIG